MVQESQTCNKVSYIGHSLGTTQVFYGMGRGSYMQPYFSQVVALAPCFIPEVTLYFPELTKELLATFSGVFELLDIESLFGPNWEKQKEDMCAVLGNDSEPCAIIKDIEPGVIAGGTIYGPSEIGVQQLEHLAQVALENRFQYYEENFFLNDLFGIKGKLVKVENIKEPPFKFLYLEEDITCPYDKQREYARKIPAFYSETLIAGREHSYVVGDNDQYFFDLLMQNLAHAPEPLSYSDCQELMSEFQEHVHYLQ